MNYMSAHGYQPGPTQRPTLAGLLAGILAAIPPLLLMERTDSLQTIAGAMGTDDWCATVLYAAIFVLAGCLYGRIFQRAANDYYGGWLFGASFGFIMWLLGPVTILQWCLHRPIVTGRAGIGMLAANILYGFVLGLIYPWVHYLIQRRFSDVFTRSWKASAEDLRCCPELPVRPRSAQPDARPDTPK